MKIAGIVVMLVGWMFLWQVLGPEYGFGSPNGWLVIGAVSAISLGLGLCRS